MSGVAMVATLLVLVLNRGEDAKDKKATMGSTYWVPGVNGSGTFGWWAFAEFTDLYEFESEFCALVGGYLPEDVAVRRPRALGWRSGRDRE